MIQLREFDVDLVIKKLWLLLSKFVYGENKWDFYLLT